MERSLCQIEDDSFASSTSAKPNSVPYTFTMHSPRLKSPVQSPDSLLAGCPGFATCAFWAVGVLVGTTATARTEVRSGR